MKDINIVLSTTDKFSSAFLRWTQRCPHSHCEIDFGEYSIGARSTGVKKYTDYPHFTHREFFHVTVTDIQYELFYEFMHSKIGDGYDFRAYLGFVLFKNTHKSSKWFCSEIIQDAFVHAGIDVIQNTPSYYCMPRDFWISPLVKEGKGQPIN